MGELSLDEPVEGIYRVEDAYTTWYVIDGGERLTVVDTDVPRSWDSLEQALPRIGRTLGDVAGHGPPWSGGIEAAVSEARAAGVA